MLKERNILHNRVALQPDLGLGVLDLARELVERAFLEGFIGVNDRVRYGRAVPIGPRA